MIPDLTNKPIAQRYVREVSSLLSQLYRPLNPLYRYYVPKDKIYRALNEKADRLKEFVAHQELKDRAKELKRIKKAKAEEREKILSERYKFVNKKPLKNIEQKIGQFEI